MSTAFPEEFRQDVVAVARRREVPKAGERYCHRRAVLGFDAVSSLRWDGPPAAPAIDATSEEDYRAIEVLRVPEEAYEVGGDFGRSRLRRRRRMSSSLTDRRAKACARGRWSCSAFPGTPR